MTTYRPMMMVSAVALLMTACATTPPVKVSDTVTAPADLLRLTCERIHPTRDAHFDGLTGFVWDARMHVVGVHCSFTTMEAGLDTVAVDIDIRVPQARELRAYLAAQGVTPSSAEDDETADCKHCTQRRNEFP
jgi:hypothetical protein